MHNLVNEHIAFIKSNAIFKNTNTLKIANKKLDRCFSNGSPNELYEVILKQRQNYMDLNKLIHLQENIDDFNQEYEKTNWQFYFRVKNTHSLNAKITKSMQGELKGKMQLKRIINDLLGFRIVIDCDETVVNIYEHLKQELNDPSLRIINSSKHGYQAIHIYINDLNGIKLPIELQIWRQKDFLHNQKAHAKNKQDHWHIDHDTHFTNQDKLTNKTDEYITHKILMYYSLITNERFIINLTKNDFKKHLIKVDNLENLAYYTYQNKSTDFADVRKEVTFFKTVKKINDMEEFIAMLKKESPLTPNQFRLNLNDYR